MSKLKDLGPGQSYTIEEKNYITGEVKRKTMYTKDKITGEIHREVIEHPNNPTRGKAIEKFRNSRLRDLAVMFLFLGMISAFILEYFENSVAKWDSLLKTSVVVFFGMFLLFLVIGMIQIEIYERKLRKEMPKLKKENREWKLADGAGLPFLLIGITLVITIIGVAIIIIGSDF